MPGTRSMTESMWFVSTLNRIKITKLMIVSFSYSFYHVLFPSVSSHKSSEFQVWYTLCLHLCICVGMYLHIRVHIHTWKLMHTVLCEKTNSLPKHYCCLFMNICEVLAIRSLNLFSFTIVKTKKIPSTLFFPLWLWLWVLMLHELSSTWLSHKKNGND